MLSIAKPILQLQLMNILKAGYMSQFDPNELSAGQKYDNNVHACFQDKANRFAQNACGPVADAIYNFVREIGIMATQLNSVIAPPLPPALPGGPCNGVIQITDYTIS